MKAAYSTIYHKERKYHKECEFIWKMEHATREKNNTIE